MLVLQRHWTTVRQWYGFQMNSGNIGIEDARESAGAATFFIGTLEVVRCAVVLHV